MAEFYVYWNATLRRVRIHRGDCPQLLRKLHSDEADGIVQGRLPAGTYDAAWRIVRELKRSKPVLQSYGRVSCGICHPGSTSPTATEAPADLPCFFGPR